MMTITAILIIVIFNVIDGIIQYKALFDFKLLLIIIKI